MPRQRSKEPTQRSLRVGEELRHALARIFERGELRDPRLHDVVVTVTEVRVSPDLKNATVFIMPLGGAHAMEAMAALRHGAAFLRKELAREVVLRFAPSLSFELDMSFDEASRINALLHRPEVQRDLAGGADEADGEFPGTSSPSVKEEDDEDDDGA